MEVEGEESVDEVRDVIQEILAYGLQHGNVENPEFQQRLAEAMRRDDAKPDNQKKSAYSLRKKPYKKTKVPSSSSSDSSELSEKKKKPAFSLKKQDKKNRAKRVQSKAADASSGDNVESSEDTCPIEVGTNDAFAPVSVSSYRHKKNQLPDDTPVYEKDEVVISGEGETSEDRELLESIQKMNINATDKLIQEGLVEIKNHLDSGCIPAFRFTDPGWRSAFITLNTTEVIGEEELSNFIDEYAKTNK